MISILIVLSREDIHLGERCVLAEGVGRGIARHRHRKFIVCPHSHDFWNNGKFKRGVFVVPEYKDFDGPVVEGGRQVPSRDSDNGFVIKHDVDGATEYPAKTLI